MGSWLRLAGLATCFLACDWGPKPERRLLDAIYRGKAQDVASILGRIPDVNRPDPHDGATFLHRAAAGNHRVQRGAHPQLASQYIQIVEALLSKGAQINARTKAQQTPLHWAAEQSIRETAAVLMTRRADLEARDMNGHTPLHIAVLFGGDPPLTELLLKAGAQVNTQDQDGCTSLHLAARSKELSPETVKLLLKYGAKVDLGDHRGKTALHDAASEGQKDMAELLVKAGAKLNAVDQDGRTPLMEAFPQPNALTGQGGATTVAELLILQGADLKLRDKEGRSALHHAYAAGAEPKLIQLMISKGADPRAKDAQGRVPQEENAGKALLEGTRKD